MGMPNIHPFHVASADDDIGGGERLQAAWTERLRGGWQIELRRRRKRISSDAEEDDESTRNRSGAFNGFATLAP